MDIIKRVIKSISVHTNWTIEEGSEGVVIRCNEYAVFTIKPDGTFRRHLFATNDNTGLVGENKDDDKIKETD